MSESRSQGMSIAVFAALMVVVITMLVQVFFENVQLRRAEARLSDQWTQQSEPLIQAENLRKQLEGIAGATAKLADEGNPNAILIRDQLRRQGVTIRPSS